MSSIQQQLIEASPATIRALKAQIERNIAAQELRRTKENAEEIRNRCMKFSGFVREAWHVLEPAQPYVHGKHIDVICDHLEAVADGRILRLIINVPPLMGKSLLVSVMFPMWCWVMVNSGMRFLGVSHEQGLAIRDNLKCRRLASSEWFNTLWPEIKITSDQNEKMNFENSKGGFRQVATMSGITGRRGDIVLLDDLLSVENANSEVERDKVNRWLKEALPLRINNPNKSAMILIMQRVHEIDAAGFIISQGWGWEHLMLPMRYEPERATQTSLGTPDWRTKAGELLFPERFNEKFTEDLETTLGDYATAGQLQQRPAPREGGLIKADKITVIEASEVPPGGRIAAGWDLAASKGEKSPFTVRVKMKRVGGNYYILHVARRRTNPTEQREMIDTYAQLDGAETFQSIPKDPGQAGKVQGWDFSEQLAGLSFEITPEQGDKTQRAMPFASMVGTGRVFMVKGDWNDPYKEEMRGFPTGQYKDQVDASSRVFGVLVRGDSLQPLGGSMLIGSGVEETAVL